MLSLRGRRALVTGASKGIGAATARLFATLGADVAVHFKADEAAALAVVALAREAGVRAEAIGADLAAWDEGDRLVAETEARLGALDVVVLNHGIWKGADIDRMSAAEYDEMTASNLRGYVSVAGAAARRMKARRAGSVAGPPARAAGANGSIVFVSSTAGQRGEAGHAHYAATKGAAISLTKSLAAELAPWGVRVNCVAPGWVATPMTEAALADARERAAVLATIPLGRVGRPEEIAWPIAFLASDAAGFVTGEIFNVNGGAVLVG